jgi:hypothetical protein
MLVVHVASGYVVRLKGNTIAAFVLECNLRLLHSLGNTTVVHFQLLYAFHVDGGEPVGIEKHKNAREMKTKRQKKKKRWRRNGGEKVCVWAHGKEVTHCFGANLGKRRQIAFHLTKSFFYFENIHIQSLRIL